MSGPALYLHIPFCKQKCAYCAFYSKCADMDQMKRYTAALCSFIKQYVTAPPATIYIGGGTPSVLPIEAWEQLLQTLERVGAITGREFTVELNPESTTEKLLSVLKEYGVNRLSFGVQSLVTEELQAVGRLHNPTQALQAIDMARSIGFDNISADLIFGLPGQTLQSVRHSLEKLLQSGICHLSCYGLQVEEGTPLAQQNPVLPDDDVQAQMYEMICRIAKDYKFEHYEISNFARPGLFSRHNSCYWEGVPYIGLGPGAHSFIGGFRGCFFADVERFIAKADRGEYEMDQKIPQTQQDDRTEKIMLGLRTSKGVEDSLIDKKTMDKYIQQGYAIHQAGRFILTEKGFLVSNSIISDLI